MNAIRRIQQGISQYAVELVHVPHERWPQIQHSTQLLRISILDSSFNPPTEAHLALINSLPPSTEGNKTDYDARVLLLSIRNADKQIQSADATYLQRLDMMVLLAKDSPRPESTAVAVIDEPAFVGKSTKLLSFLKSRTEQPIELTFLLGFDTLERFLSAKYYSTESAMHAALKKFFELEKSRIVCAHRVSDSTNMSDPAKTLALAGKYGSSPHITLINIPSPQNSFSSSGIRKLIAKGAGNEYKERMTERVGNYVEREGLYITDEK